MPPCSLLATTAWSILLLSSYCHAFLGAPSYRSTTTRNNKGLGAHASSGPYDLAVVGAGVVGVQAALLAAQTATPAQGRKVILIDAPRASGMLMNEATGEDLSLGGPTGLFSKALRDTSKRMKVASMRGMGLREDSIWNEIIQSCVDLASSNAQDLRRQLETAGVEYLAGYASFADSGETDELSVETEDGSVVWVRAKNILLATGSQPFRPRGIPFDNMRILDSDTINGLSYLPKSMAITGSVRCLSSSIVLHHVSNFGEHSHRFCCLHIGHYCRRIC